MPLCPVREVICVIENWKDKFAPHILPRGEKYFQEGNIQKIQHCGNVYIATVTGSYDYKVEIFTTENVVAKMRCNCPYADGSNCKHMAAVLFAIESGTVSIEELPPVKQPALVSHIPIDIPWTEAIDKLPEDVVRKELMRQADRNQRLQERLAFLYLGKLPEGMLQNWKADLQEIAGDYIDDLGRIDSEDSWSFLEELNDFLDQKLPLLLEINAIMDAFHLVWIVMETALEWTMEDTCEHLEDLFHNCDVATTKVLSKATADQREEMLQWYREHRDENWPGEVRYLDTLFKVSFTLDSNTREKRVIRFFGRVPHFQHEGEWASFPERGFEYYDFVEDTEDYKKAILQVRAIIKKQRGDQPYRFGACHAIWQQEQDLLWKLFGIHWFKPTELNPHIRYD